MSHVGEYVKFHMVPPKTECVGPAFYKTHFTRPHPALILTLPHVNMCTRTHNVHTRSQHPCIHLHAHYTCACAHITCEHTIIHIHSMCAHARVQEGDKGHLRERNI